MKMLNITGPAGAGKSTALRALRDTRNKKISTVLVDVPKGGVRQAKEDLVAQLEGQPDQVYIDIEGRGTPSFLAWITRVCASAGVAYLTVAQAS